jgi:hypothetical protein
MSEFNGFNVYQVLQSTLAGLIVLILSGIYYNYSNSLELSKNASAQVAQQLAVMAQQIQTIQEKVNGIPTIQSDLISLKVQTTELERRIDVIERKKDSH